MHDIATICVLKLPSIHSCIMKINDVEVENFSINTFAVTACTVLKHSRLCTTRLSPRSYQLESSVCRLALTIVKCTRTHSVLFITITQLEGWCSFYRSTEGRRLSWPRWLATYWHGFTCLQRVTHPSTNPAWCRVTTFIINNKSRLSAIVQEWRLSLFGHIARMPDETDARSI